MKKFLMILAAAAFCALPAAVQAQKGIVYRNDGKTVEFDSIQELSPERYGCKVGRNTLPIAKKDVQRILVEKPQVIADADKMLADGKFAEAAEKYKAALDAKNNVDKGAIAFKDLGWNIYCLYKRAESLKKAGSLDDALKLFTEISGMKDSVLNPDDGKFVFSSQLEIGETFLAKKDYVNTEKIAKELARNPDPKAGFCGYLLRGKNLKAQAAEKSGVEQETLIKKAALSFFGASLLFEKDEQRPEALYLAWEMLTALKDVRAEAFAKILKEKYPDNTYTKKLK